MHLFQVDFSYQLRQNSSLKHLALKKTKQNPQINQTTKKTSIEGAEYPEDG